MYAVYLMGRTTPDGRRPFMIMQHGRGKMIFGASLTLFSLSLILNDTLIQPPLFTTLPFFPCRRRSLLQYCTVPFRKLIAYVAFHFMEANVEILGGWSTHTLVYIATAVPNHWFYIRPRM